MISGDLTTVRHVTTWYYLLTGLAAITAIIWLVRRDCIRFGIRLLGGGILLNAAWEFTLFTAWGRHYVTPFPTLIHAVYQSLTEFGSLLVLVVLTLSYTPYIDLEPWQDRQRTRLHTGLRTLGLGLLTLWIGIVLTLLTTTPAALHSPITVIRHVTPVYFLVEGLLAVIVLIIATIRRQRTAVLLFVIMGASNGFLEVVGLIGGYRTYHGLTVHASLLIGLCESGTAAAIVWMGAQTTYERTVVQG